MDFTDLTGAAGNDWFEKWQTLLQRLTTLTDEFALLRGESTTAMTVGAGAKTLDVGTGGAWRADDVVVAYKRGTPSTFVIGTVDDYDGPDLEFTVESGDFGGAGEHDDWIVVMAGRRGAQGPQGDGVPTPSGATDAGKVPVVNGTGDGYALTNATLGAKIAARTRAY